MGTGTVIRAIGRADLPGVAALKREWNGAGAADDGFETALGSWIARMGEALVPRVAEVDGALVGMAWLVLFERVPDPGDLHRVTGDVQSVFVRPPFRGRGIGRALVAALLAEADRRGVPRTTVHSSARAVPLYEGLGFRAAPVLLQRARPADAPGAPRD